MADRLPFAAEFLKRLDERKKFLGWFEHLSTEQKNSWEIADHDECEATKTENNEKLARVQKLMGLF